MTNKEAIKLIQEIEEDGRNVTSEHVEALDLAIKALESDRWIPVTYRPMTDEEEKERCEKLGIEEGSLEDWEKRVFTCSLPDDGQEILISRGEYVQEDICSWVDYACGLNYADWDGVDAWMPKRVTRSSVTSVSKTLRPELAKELTVKRASGS